MTSRTDQAGNDGGRTGVDDAMLRLLTSIDRRLALLTAPQERDMRRRLVDEVLRAGGRQAMWDAIDGRKTSNDLASAAGVSSRFAQLFVNELLDMGLVRKVARELGRGTVVERDGPGLVEWYVTRTADKTTTGAPPESGRS
jgi:hypothetical protein